jgi:chemotaxis methyl-accepting protein methylase
MDFEYCPGRRPEPCAHFVAFLLVPLFDAALATNVTFFAPGVFDLVLCRNVAIYFEEDFKKDLFSRLAQVITPNGLLMLGGTESLFTHKHLFAAENISGSYFYRRI